MIRPVRVRVSGAKNKATIVNKTPRNHEGGHDQHRRGQIDAAERVGIGNTGKQRDKIEHHLQHRAGQLAQHDLPGRQRGDRQQLQRPVVNLAFQRSVGRQRYHQQHRQGQDKVVPNQHSRCRWRGVNLRHHRKTANDRPRQGGKQQHGESDHELTALERLTRLLDQNRIQGIANANAPVVDAIDPMGRRLVLDGTHFRFYRRGHPFASLLCLALTMHSTHCTATHCTSPSVTCRKTSSSDFLCAITSTTS